MENEEDDLPLGAIPVINPSIISRDTLDEGLVIVNCDTGGSFALNLTGKLIWESIDGKRGPQEITTYISRYFFDIPEKVGDDVVSLLSVLAGEGFIGYELLK